MIRNPYMQKIMDETYNEVAIIAIKNGTLEGAWEQAVAARLMLDFDLGVSAAEVILQSVDYDEKKAADLIITSSLPEIPQAFNIEFQYQEYLKRVNLSEEHMHSQQKKQLRETFFGAVGAVLILLRNQTQVLSVEDSIKAFQSMLDQVGEFFLKNSSQQN